MSEHYSAKVLDHVHNPRNVGSIEDANVVVQAGDPSCGDALVFFIKIENDIIHDIKFLIKGCGAAIATSSMATELVMGRHLDEVIAINDQKIAAALDGLPGRKNALLKYGSFGAPRSGSAVPFDYGWRNTTRGISGICINKTA